MGICASVLLLCAGCATAREPISAVNAASATIPGYVGIRTWADEKPDRLARMLRSPRFAVTATHDVNFLALSSGGAAGSFSAGALKGWTSTAQRPEFDIVSGVSTGALIAPFAFLGSDYDDLLEAPYTGDTTRGFAEPQSPFKIASTGGIVDSEPLRRVVERYATQSMLDRIAEEPRKGRRLVVITTNLDQQRAVLCDLGAIASSGRADALRLFQDVLVASASVPAIYPPVMIQAVGDRGPVSEMHVDGATTTQVFVVPGMLKQDRSQGGAASAKHVHLWVIINNTPPEFGLTTPGAIPIAVRSIATLMKSQTGDAVKAASEAAARLRMAFNIAYIDKDSAIYDPSHPYAKTYMDAVFALGREEARTGVMWRRSLMP